MTQRQEVNLYQSELHEKREQLTASQMASLVGIALLSMLLYSGWTAYSLNSLKTHNQQLTSQLNQQRQTVTALASMTRPEPTPNCYNTRVGWKTKYATCALYVKRR